MLVLGHAGITLGAAALLTGAASGGRTGRMPRFTALSQYVDIRLLFLGSMLPDIIDKPVGLYFFRETLSNGRIFCHTLLFLVLLAAGGLFLFKSRRRVWLLTLAAGTLAHLVLDRMWLTPRTLLWPFFGTAFDRIELYDWMSNILEALFQNAAIYIPEAIGFVILLWFGITLLARRKVIAFLMSGEL